MLQTNYQNDPIVEILRLAARRGFEIMRQREQIAAITPLKQDAPDGDQGDGYGSANGDSRNVPARCIEDADTQP
jgi:hypothetical protein